MKGKIILDDLEIEFDSKISDVKLVGLKSVEFKTTGKIRVKGAIKWLLELLKLS